MAKNTGGNGSSKIPPTAAEQNLIRRAAKKNRRDNRKGGGYAAPVDSLMVGVSKDRAKKRAAEAAERAARRQRLLHKVLTDTMGHLKRFGNKQVPGKKTPGDGSMRPRWNASALEAVERLLNLYFFGPADEIEVREGMMGKQVVAEVRRRFAAACHKNWGVKDTPGQAQPWFAEALAAAEHFYRKPGKPTSTQVPATTVETPASSEAIAVRKPVSATA